MLVSFAVLVFAGNTAAQDVQYDQSKLAEIGTKLDQLYESGVIPIMLWTFGGPVSPFILEREVTRSWAEAYQSPISLFTSWHLCPSPSFRPLF